MRAFRFRTKFHSYAIFDRRSSASTHTPRSIVGDTAQTAFSSGGAASAKLARQLQREVPAQRIPGDGDGRDAIALDQLADDEQRIVRQPRVVEARATSASVPPQFR